MHMTRGAVAAGTQEARCLSHHDHEPRGSRGLVGMSVKWSGTPHWGQWRPTGVRRAHRQSLVFPTAWRPLPH